MDAIKELFMWLLPAGGMGSLVGWIAGKKLRRTRGEREAHDTYRVMYNDLRETLLELQNENKKLFKTVARLEKAVWQMERCEHANDCPVGLGLHEPKGSKINDDA